MVVVVRLAVLIVWQLYVICMPFKVTSETEIHLSHRDCVTNLLAFCFNKCYSSVKAILLQSEYKNINNTAICPNVPCTLYRHKKHAKLDATLHPELQCDQRN